MKSALIVSYSPKSIAFFTDMLHSVDCDQIAVATSCGEARRLIIDRDFDLYIINAPLPDETGESLSKHISSKGASQVILVVSAEYFEEVSDAVEDYGVITVAKPVNRNIFWSALKLAKASHNKLKAIRDENEKLMQKIEDIRLVDRAKCILISILNMSENEAHKYIERRAMDMRMTKRAVAQEIIKTYES